MERQMPLVSVVIPIYNEEKYIQKCIESLLMQDYPRECSEWIFVDGMSSDKTKEIIAAYIEKYPSLISCLDNPDRTVPYAMNRGIRASKGEYIIRLDAHAEYMPDYISKCVYYLENTGADNVGGVLETKAKTKMGSRIALMLSSRFGVGNAQFRVNGKDGYVDTVPFGAFRREVFSKYGYFDERFTRNQDNEMNWRIRKGGGKIYMSNDIKLVYYCRESISSINKMGYINGKWNIITMYLCFGSMGIRHFVPFAFVLSLVLMPLLSLLSPVFLGMFIVELLAYLTLDLISSIIGAAKTEEEDAFICALTLFALFPMFHISYGVGSIAGLVVLNTKKFKKDGTKGIGGSAAQKQKEERQKQMIK